MMNCLQCDETSRMWLIVSGLLLVVAQAAQASDKISSPNGQLHVEFSLASDGVPTYRIDYRGKSLILESRLGLLPDLLGGFELSHVEHDDHRSQWTNPFGERSQVPDVYQELHCDLRHPSGALLRITFRAYDEGIAFRYTLPQQATATFAFAGERSEFCFPTDTYGYEEHGTEGEYRRVLVDDFLPYCERPVTLEYKSGTFAALTEAANLGYARTLFSPVEGRPGALVTALGGNTSNTENPNQRHDPNVKLLAGDATPWRVLLVGDSPGELLEHNYLILNLNPPCALADTSWIKPGKVMRDPTLTTKVSKEIIDFAKHAGIGYVHLDADWYGPERDARSDATMVNSKRAHELNLAEIVHYGQQKSVGLIVYVNDIALKQQLDTLLPLYEKWGLTGIKFGFVRVGSQAETTWITSSLQKAAEHKLMINIHDGFRATGINRTYPHLMTVEGIRGNEHMPTAEHNCTLPFTRYLTGIGDYTICYYNNRIQTTHAHQLAMNVVSFSPLQWIFWYDKPDLYRGESEVEFFREVPTVWDETRVIHGEIGKYATIARRSGEQWFVGTINSSEPRTLQVPLTFLKPGKEYLATTYSDDETLATRTNVRIDKRVVECGSVLEVQLISTGGQAIWIRPQ